MSAERQGDDLPRSTVRREWATDPKDWPVEGNMLRTIGDFEPCWNCGEPCETVEVNFEARLHPGACEDAKWREYEEACRAQGPDDNSDPFP